jgi:hypothetical protein
VHQAGRRPAAGSRAGAGRRAEHNHVAYGDVTERRSALGDEAYIAGGDSRDRPLDRVPGRPCGRDFDGQAAGCGRPLINPFPQARGIDDGSLNAHHNPMQPFRQPPRRAAYQPNEPKPAPRSIPEQAFNELFAGLTSNRDRALIAFYISTGARAAELLGVVQGLLAPEDQTIGVLRKGSQALQHLPASADAFVWLGFTSTRC